jgi:hypothetical protein
VRQHVQDREHGHSGSGADTAAGAPVTTSSAVLAKQHFVNLHFSNALSDSNLASIPFGRPIPAARLARHPHTSPLARALPAHRSRAMRVGQELAGLSPAQESFAHFRRRAAMTRPGLSDTLSVTDMKQRRRQSRTRRPCTICRVRFWAVRRDARFCSPRCRQRAVRAPSCARSKATDLPHSLLCSHVKPRRCNCPASRARPPRRRVRERTTIMRLIMRPRAETSRRRDLVSPPRRAILMGYRVVAGLAIAIECLSGNRAGPEVQDRHQALLIPCVER